MGLPALILLCAGAALLFCRAPARLPSSWPVKELALPNGASVGELDDVWRDKYKGVTTLDGVQSDRGFPHRRWAVGFQCRLSFDQMIKETDSQLKLAGYFAKPPMLIKTNYQTGQKKYLSADGRTEIILTYWTRPFAPWYGVWPYRGFDYRVYVFDEPLLADDKFKPLSNEYHSP